MSNFDSLCDPSAPGRIPTDDDIWRAVMELGNGSRAPATSTISDPVCAACEGGGWECYGIGHGDPHFRTCEACGNPEGLPSP